MYLYIFLRIASACSVGKIQRRLQGKFVLIFKFIMQNSNLFDVFIKITKYLVTFPRGDNPLFVRFSASLRVQSRGTQREYSSKPLKHSIVERIVVCKR